MERNHHHWSTLENQYHWRPPWTFHWKPQYCLQRPCFSLNTQDFHWTPRFVLKTPSFSLEIPDFFWRPHDFHWIPHILLESSRFYRRPPKFFLKTPKIETQMKKMGSPMNLKFYEYPCNICY